MASVLAPTQPTASSDKVISVSPLLERADYLSTEDQARLVDAFRFADAAHLGQSRQSGEPYISHPIAVAEVCTQWRLDADALIAALLHDTVEDCGVTQTQIAKQFGSNVAMLVEGLTKLDKVSFRNREEAQAENFRKMLLSMADDVRVILIKLADRLHNMRTLASTSVAKRTRVARETLDIYAPIAHRLGLNEIFREFEDLCFDGLYPRRSAVLQKALKAARGNRKEIIGRIRTQICDQLPHFGINAVVSGRTKSLYSVYVKMKEKHLSFAEVLDIYGFRVCVSSIPECYIALGALHALFKPVPGKFKDYIALPKSNGYQSLHTVVVGPLGTPLEFQIRTHQMHQMAEAGVAAHWLYKEHAASVTPLQRKAHEWMQSLLSVQSPDPKDFLDHIKIDLFPDVIYVFTPTGEIRELPKGSTPVDFAYMVHTDVGNRCTGATINNEVKPLDTELRNGDLVRVVTQPTATPHPGWLGFVRTARARSQIRYNLKTSTRERAVAFGRRLLDSALKALGSPGVDDPSLNWSQFFHEIPANDREGLLEAIGLGHLLANVAARRLLPTPGSSDGDTSPRTRRLTPAAERALQLSMEHLTAQHDLGITVNGSEGTAVQYAPCCHPIAGDTSWGYMRGGAGLLIHRASCGYARRQRPKDPNRWADIIWGDPIYRTFETHLNIDVKDAPGALAKVAGAISASEANIIDLTIERRGGGFSTLKVVLEVRGRTHLADVLRRVRLTASVNRAVRLLRHSPKESSRLTAGNGHSIDE
ncbi:MAG: RelA/SpoT family protein [Burkholderiaceae bacterium]